MSPQFRNEPCCAWRRRKRRPYERRVMSDRTVLALVPPAPATPRERGELQRGQCIEQTRRYRLLSQVGEGGMGTIWRALDEALDREVAISPQARCADRVAVAFAARRRSVRASSTRTSCACWMQGSQLRDGDEWLAMDLLHGHDLGDLLEMQGRIGIPVLVDVFSQALGALAYVHARRLVHRDIKPYNIFVARRPGERGFVVKLIDFGICRNLGVPEAADHDQIVGDPRYMPPEQAKLGAPVDARTNLYALGLSFAEAATGRHPYGAWFGAPVHELLRAHRNGLQAEPSSALPGGVSRGFRLAFDNLVAKACAPDPTARFADAESMVDALAGLAGR